MGVATLDRIEGLAIVERADELSEIHGDGCAAALWRREPLAEFQGWIDGLAAEHLPAVRVALRAKDVGDALTHVFDSAGLAECAHRDRLRDDICVLAHLFQGLMATRFIRLRLDVVRNNACSKFHMDAVSARLICTYRGQGTQYGLAMRSGLPDPIMTAPTGCPLILRGSLWPTKPKIPVVHRSPPIQGTGETRLLLVLDPATGPDDV